MTSDAGTSGGGAPAEFSRTIDPRQADGRTVTVEADAEERAALARRFDIIAIDRLVAEVTFNRRGETIAVEGALDAAIVQSCAVSAEELFVLVAEPLSFRFVPARQHHRPEVELEADELDEIEYDGATFDFGEAVAQSLALSIDPFATGPRADDVRRAGGLLDQGASGPFAVLARLRKQ